MKITKKVILDVLEKSELKLRPNQDKISLPIINRIFKKMSNNLIFSPIKVNGDLIIEGHHRYISSRLANFDLEIIYNYPKPSVVNEYNWADIAFLEIDFDSKEYIRLLNEDDAKYNNIPIEKILEMIK